jgi:hypothetical protein
VSIVVKPLFPANFSRRAVSLLAGSLNPVPSEQIGGRSDVATNAIQTSLAALKHGSAALPVLVSAPYISQIVGLLLQILKMRGVSILVCFRDRLY